MRRSVIIAAVLLTSFDRAVGDDWPAWRGPSGQGITSEKNLPGANSLTLRWKTLVPGAGCSSPVVSQGRVYVTTAFQGEKPNPWDWSVALAIIILAGCAAGLALTRFPKAFLSLARAGAEGSFRSLCGLGILTAGVIALTTEVLAKPKWFMQFSDDWSGTRVAPAELSVVESLYLRPVIVCLLGSMLLVYARLALPADGEKINAKLMTSWLLLVTVCSTLTSAVAAGLMATHPDWFWQPGQPWLAWIVTGGLALFILAASVGWLAEASWLRPIMVASGLALAGWLFANTPSDQFTAVLDLRIRLACVVPGSALLVAHGIVFILARSKDWPKGESSNRFMAMLLPMLGLALFARSDYLRPETGLVRAVVCVDARSGALLWNTPVMVARAEKTHAFNSHATPTPVTDGDHVYAYFGCGLAALDKDGRLLWLNRDPDYHRYSRYGAGSSLVLADDSLIVYEDSEFMGHGHHMDDDAEKQEGRRASTLSAFDKKTGARRWRVTPSFSHDSYMTPLVWQHEGQLAVVVSTWKTLAGFAVNDGSLLWKHKHPMQQIVPSPAVNGDCLIVTGGNVFPCPLYAIRPPARGEPGQTLWSVKKGGANMVSPVCWKGRLFSISHLGLLTCLDAATGEVHWDHRFDSRFLASLVAGDDKVFALDRDGTLYVIAATADGGELAKLSLFEQCAATPALADQRVFVRTANHLCCISD